MFYNAVVDDWGTTYVPTTLGKVLLAVLLIALLVCAVVFARKYTAKQNQETEGTAKKSGREGRNSDSIQMSSYPPSCS